MALYHKWGVKTGFTCALQFFIFISDGLDGVYYFFHNIPSEITTFYRTTPKKESLGMTTVFNCAGVDKKEFEKYTESHPATYDDWSRTWQQETTGKS